MKIPTDLDPRPPPLRRILAQNPPPLKEFLDPPLGGAKYRRQRRGEQGQVWLGATGGGRI